MRCSYRTPSLGVHVRVRRDGGFGGLRGGPVGRRGDAVLVDDRMRRRGDAEGGEPLLQRRAVAVVVVGRQALVGGEDRVEDVGELELHRRQVVQGAQQHGQQVPGRLDALLRDPLGVEAAAVRAQGLQPARPDRHQRLQERRDQHLGAPVGFGELPGPSSTGRRRAGPPTRAAPGTGRRRRPRRRPLRPAAPQLLRQPEQRRALQLACPFHEQGGAALLLVVDPERRRVAGERHTARALRIEQVLRDPVEVDHRQHGHQVGQRLVEGQLVGQAGLGEPRPQPVEHGMADLVCDHVVGQRGVQGGPASEPGQPAEEDGVVLAGVERVRLEPGPGHQEELREARVPRDRPAEVLLEQRQRVGRDGVHVLGPELPLRAQRRGVGVLLGRPAVAVHPRTLGVQDHGRGRRVGADVHVDHVQAMTARPPLEAPGRHRDRGADRPAVVDHGRILGQHRHQHRLLGQEVGVSRGRRGGVDDLDHVRPGFVPAHRTPSLRSIGASRERCDIDSLASSLIGPPRDIGDDSDDAAHD